jgi:hypothetical protein
VAALAPLPSRASGLTGARPPRGVLLSRERSSALTGASSLCAEATRFTWELDFSLSPEGKRNCFLEAGSGAA